MSALVRLGWCPFFDDQRARAARPDLRWARVVQEQRERYQVAGEFDGPAEVSGRLRHAAAGPADFPAVGDWVGVATGEPAGSWPPTSGGPGGSWRPPSGEPGGSWRPPSGGPGGSWRPPSGGPGPRAIIHHRLERRSTVSRRAAGRAVEKQVVAANVDVMLLVTAVDGDVNPRRLERYLTMVWEAGAVPVVVLNKADLIDDPASAARQVEARLPFVDVVVVSALTDRGLETLTPYLRPGQTLALVGSSGVGKSTLLNRLMGEERQRVATVRARDRRGRHTTTARELVELPGGALLIDTPGMRELQPWAEAAAVPGAFEEIGEIAQRCRFTDCAHIGEPGCAVLAAVAEGTLDADRLEHYRKLLREAIFEDSKRDKAVAANVKRRWKQLHQAHKAMYKDRERS